MKRKERLEAITISVGYADFLHEIAQWNRQHFDEWIIGTDPKDEATREVCRKFNLKCIVSEDHRRHGEGFNKGRLIERCLHHTSKDAWRLHHDCDIVLPTHFRMACEAAELRKDFIYGADRIDVIGWDKWVQLKNSGFVTHQIDYGCRVNTTRPGYETGTRFAYPKFGYVPIGYFQLWHSSEDEWRGVRTKSYPTEHGSACRTDVQFGLQWDRAKRAVLPEVVTAHLMSENAPKGTNWNGRMTKPFGPPPKPEPNAGYHHHPHKPHRPHHEPHHGPHHEPHKPPHKPHRP